MSSFEKASRAFDTNFEIDDYFDSLSAEQTKNRLLELTTEKSTAPVFLLGEPGSGKTYMLHLLKERFADEKAVIFCSEPFATPEHLVRFLLHSIGEAEEAPLFALKEKAIALFSQKPHLILIDEAQVFDETIFEFIRILSDSGAFSFVIAMHEEEGRQILGKKHFASREHHRLFLGSIDRDELDKYIRFQLNRHEVEEIAAQFTNKRLKRIYTLTNGNFRMTKRYLKTLFGLMDYAHKKGLKSHTSLNTCLLNMTALDLGLIHE